jgi:hypothetical protein
VRSLPGTVWAAILLPPTPQPHHRTRLPVLRPVRLRRRPGRQRAVSPFQAPSDTEAQEPPRGSAQVPQREPTHRGPRRTALFNSRGPVRCRSSRHDPACPGSGSEGRRACSPQRSCARKDALLVSMVAKRLRRSRLLLPQSINWPEGFFEKCPSKVEAASSPRESIARTLNLCLPGSRCL